MEMIKITNDERHLLRDLLDTFQLWKMDTEGSAKTLGGVRVDVTNLIQLGLVHRVRRFWLVANVQDGTFFDVEGRIWQSVDVWDGRVLFKCLKIEEPSDKAAQKAAAESFKEDGDGRRPFEKGLAAAWLGILEEKEYPIPLTKERLDFYLKLIGPPESWIADGFVDRIKSEFDE